jgi:hypothetical protein
MLPRIPEKDWRVSELRPHQVVGMEPIGWDVIS